MLNPNIETRNLKPKTTTQPLGSVRPKPILVTRDWLVAVVLLVVIIFLWIGYGVYQALTTTRVPEPLKEQTRPLSIEIDRQILDELQGRLRLKDKELREDDRVILRQEEETSVSSPSGQAESAP